MAADLRDATEPVEVKKRRLRTTLRAAREEANLTQAAAAKALFWSNSKLVRIELGTSPVAPSDVRAMLNVYGVSDAKRIQHLVELAAEAREVKGWSEYSDVLGPATLELVGNEPAAKVIVKYEPSLVPGLFQTQAYARALLRALGNSSHEIDRRLEVRAQRQLMLERPERPELNFILGEATLSRPIGSEETMREQIDHLLELAQVKGISIMFLPFSAGAHRGMGNAFTVLQFTDANLADLLYLENAERESVSRDEQGTIAEYLRLFAELRDLSESGLAMEARLRKIRDERFPARDGETDSQQ